MRHGVGATIDGLDQVGVDSFTALFSESSARAVVAVPAGSAAAFEALLDEVPHRRIGATGGRDLEIAGLFSVSVSELDVGPHVHDAGGLRRLTARLPYAAG